MSGEFLTQQSSTLAQPFPENGDGFNPSITESPVSPEATPEFSFDELMDLAERRANTFRLQLIENRHPEGHIFGKQLEMAFDHPDLADHGHHHSRHVELYMKKILKEFNKTYPDFYDPKDPRTLKILSAMFLFPYKHDVDQLLSGVRNFDRSKDAQLKVKKGHGPAGGLEVLALTDEYATATEMTYDEAFEITSLYNLMTTRHDEPEKFTETFNPENRKAYTINDKGEKELLTGVELLTAFEEDELDLFSLAPSQYVEITRMIKAKNGFIGEDEDSVLGLPPSLEAFKPEMLFWLSVDNKATFDNVDDDTRDKIVTAAEICKVSDEFDMFAPYLYQHARTLTTQYSKNRPFSIFQPKKHVTVAEAFDLALNGEGDAPTDDTRLLWEMLHLNGGKSRISEVPWIRQFYKEHAIAGVLLLRDIGDELMNAEFTIFKRIYHHRIEQITAKYQRKIATVEHPESYKASYESKVEMIQHEYDELEQAFWQKMRKQNDDGTAFYPEKQQAQFRSLMRRGLIHLVRFYNVTTKGPDSELAGIRERVRCFQELPSMEGVMDGNDSLPMTRGIKTLKNRKPKPELIQGQLL